ncbi:1-acyl-sn-glycerol-3-phosphate acyltransferase [Patescibacteria group bacterium]|nr:1-acyl-sn-glycerol-3-phosphate acyltransferase [Patescibacteria group bacterium]
MNIKPKSIFFFLASNIRHIVYAVFLGKVEGIENLPKPPFILALNHVSIPDAWLVTNLMISRFKIPAWIIGRDDFWLGKIWSNFIGPRLGGIIIDWREPHKALERAHEILLKKGIVGIFPEGTRNSDPRALCLGKTGAARLALSAKVPVVCVGYFGPKIATTFEAIKNFVFKRNLARIVFGKPLDFSEYYGKTIDRELLYEATDKIMVQIGALCGKRPRLHNI